MNLLYPRISREAFGRMARSAGLGAVIAGGYGIVHDQVTYTMSPEYFTEFKFHQFHWADIGLPDRVFAGLIGFLATWWVGLIAGWALGRLAEFRRDSPENQAIVIGQFPRLLATAAGFGGLGFLFACVFISTTGQVEAAFPSVEEPTDFLTVGYIHNFGYAGAVVGLIVAGRRVWKQAAL